MSAKGGHYAPSECNNLNQLYLQQLRFSETIRLEVYRSDSCNSLHLKSN